MLFSSLISALALLGAVVLHPAAMRPPAFLLSSTDRQVGLFATQLAGRSVQRAMQWARHAPSVSSVRLGRDGRTIELGYSDGRQLVILPPGTAPVRVSPSPRVPLARQRADVGAKALVLEPFADELGLGSSAGDEEAQVLTDAGFSVDVLRNQQVTVPVLQRIPQYAVTYVDTHSGVLDNGDAVVVAGESDPNPYADYFRDHTLRQATVAGDPSRKLYNAVTGAFYVAHAEPFRAGSLLYLNGCSVLSASGFWSAVHGRGLAAMISWDAQAQVTTDESAASYVWSQLARGQSVGPVVNEAVTEGIGVSLVDGQVAHVGYRGAGDETLADALHGTDAVTPAPRPTAMPTSAPTHKGACKRGHHRSHGRCVKTRHHHEKHYPSYRSVRWFPLRIAPLNAGLARYPKAR